MEEFQQLEGELERLFEQYSVRVRCVNMLEQMVAEAERAHLERQATLSAQQKITRVVPMEPGDKEELLSFEEQAPGPRQAPITRMERPRARTGGKFYIFIKIGSVK